MDVDWWHIANVVTLSLALGCEAIGAYCSQKGHLRDWVGRLKSPTVSDEARLIVSDPPHQGKITNWSRLWLREAEHERFPGVVDAIYREGLLDPEFGSLVRGIGRLSVATLFLVRFAAGQPPPFLG